MKEYNGWSYTLIRSVCISLNYISTLETKSHGNSCNFAILRFKLRRAYEILTALKKNIEFSLHLNKNGIINRTVSELPVEECQGIALNGFRYQTILGGNHNVLSRQWSSNPFSSIRGKDSIQSSNDGHFASGPNHINRINKCEN